MEAVVLEEQAGGGYRQEVNVAARLHEEEELCQAIELSLRHPSLPDLELTATSESESESEGAEAVLPRSRRAVNTGRRSMLRPGHMRKGSAARH